MSDGNEHERGKDGKEYGEVGGEEGEDSIGDDGFKAADETCGVGEQRESVADDVMGGILQAINSRPVADGLRAFELRFDVGKLLDELAELLFGSQVIALGIQARVELQTDTAQGIGRSGVIVEGNNPQPAALEDVMKRPL